MQPAGGWLGQALGCRAGNKAALAQHGLGWVAAQQRSLEEACGIGSSAAFATLAAAEAQSARAGLAVAAVLGLLGQVAGTAGGRRRQPAPRRVALVARTADREGAPPRPGSAGADDGGLPSDEELRRSLFQRLPAVERIRREMGLRAEGTLRRADERIAALGIDLTAAEREQPACRRVERMQLLPPLPAEGPLVAVCGPRPHGQEAEQPVQAALRGLLPEASVRWLDLGELGGGGLAEEEVRELLVGCEAVAVCPGADIEISAAGLALLLRSLPESVCRFVLFSPSFGKDAADPADGGPMAAADAMIFGRSRQPAHPMKKLENLLTVAGRERGAGDAPLYIAIVRAALGETEAPARASARLPATVHEASWGLRSMLVGGIQTAGPSEEAGQEVGGAAASAATTAAALAFALRRGVDVPELSVAGHCGECGGEWEELMLPLVGPELWRLPVEEPKRALTWIRGWVDFNYCRGANRAGPAMRRAGLKTPVEVREVPLGVCLKFAPPGMRQPGAGFDGLREGGLEILVDEERDGRPGRLRVRRCSYGWRKKPREGSERAILSKLRRDWEMARSFR